LQRTATPTLRPHSAAFSISTGVATAVGAAAGAGAAALGGGAEGCEQAAVNSKTPPPITRIKLRGYRHLGVRGTLERGICSRSGSDRERLSFMSIRTSRSSEAPFCRSPPEESTSSIRHMFLQVRYPVKTSGAVLITASIARNWPRYCDSRHSRHQ
jgi:hypothetical protein